MSIKPKRQRRNRDRRQPAKRSTTSNMNSTRGSAQLDQNIIVSPYTHQAACNLASAAASAQPAANSAPKCAHNARAPTIINGKYDGGVHTSNIDLACLGNGLARAAISDSRAEPRGPNSISEINASTGMRAALSSRAGANIRGASRPTSSRS